MRNSRGDCDRKGVSDCAGASRRAGRKRVGPHFELLESRAVLADPGEHLVESLCVQSALDSGHVVPQLVVDEVVDPLVLRQCPRRLLEGRVGAQEVVYELVAEPATCPGRVLGRLDRVGQGGEVVDAGLSDAQGAVALGAEVGEFALQGAHARDHGVDAGEHVAALGIREGGGGGRLLGGGVEGGGGEEGGEVLSKGAGWLEVVLVCLLGLLVDLAESIERSLMTTDEVGGREGESRERERERE